MESNISDKHSVSRLELKVVPQESLSDKIFSFIALTTSIPCIYNVISRLNRSLRDYCKKILERKKKEYLLEVRTSYEHYFHLPDGRREGVYERFYCNVLVSSSIFVNGKEEGCWWSTDMNGNMEGGIYKNGLLHGTYIATYRNKRLKERSNWFLGKKEGLFERWSNDGKLKEKCLYKNDRVTIRFSV